MLTHSKVTMSSKITFLYIRVVHFCQTVRISPPRLGIGDPTILQMERSTKRRSNSKLYFHFLFTFIMNVCQRIHSLVYFCTYSLPYVEERYYERDTGNNNVIPFLKDNGEGRRLGTLAVFVDQGIIEDRPLLAIPINLSLVLDLPDSNAYVGFTASTGRRWEKHDVLCWEWLEK